MGADSLLTILGAVLSAAATYGPALYRAIVPDGRTPEQVIADARKAIAAIPHAPAADGIEDALSRRNGGG